MPPDQLERLREECDGIIRPTENKSNENLQFGGGVTATDLAWSPFAWN